MVQVVQAKIHTGDPLEDALTIVRAVDLKCCGIAMDKFGRLLEAVEGGFEDCKSRILRINKYDPLRNAESTKARIHKYLDRGWQLGTSIDTIMENFKKIKEEHMRQQAAKAAHQRRRLNSLGGKLPPGTFVQKDDQKQGSIKIYQAIINEVGLSQMHGMLCHHAKKHCGCPLHLEDHLVKRDFMLWRPEKGYHMDLKGAEIVLRRAINELMAEHGIDLYNLGKMKKKPSAVKAEKYGYGSSHPSYQIMYDTATVSYANAGKTTTLADLAEAGPTPEEAPELQEVEEMLDEVLDDAPEEVPPEYHPAAHNHMYYNPHTNDEEEGN